MQIVKCPACKGKQLSNIQKMAGIKCGFCFGLGEMEMDVPEPVPETKPKRKYTKKKDVGKDE